MADEARIIREGVYNNDYFCLTDNNFLIVKRGDSIQQIKPSEFQDGDKLKTLNEYNIPIWAEVFCTRSIVQKGDEIVQINSQGGYLELTTGHKLFNENKDIVAAGNFNSGDKLCITEINKLPDDKSIGIGEAYSLGAFAAEGTSQEGLSKAGNGNWKIEFTLHYKERSFAHKIAQSLIAFGNNLNINPIIKEYSEYTRRTVGVYSKDFVLFLKSLGALGLCYEKRIPSCIFSATRQEKLAYLASLFEGDSYFKDNKLCLGLTSKALIDGTHILLSSLGINSKLGYEKSSMPNNKDTYYIHLYGKDNLGRFIQLCGKYLLGWKYKEAIETYSISLDGHVRYSEQEIMFRVKEEYPISLAGFYKKTGITQAVIVRLFGSWNNCIKACGLKPNKGRWGDSCQPFIKECNNSIKPSNLINSVHISAANEDILVYDFTVPIYESFLINNILSHNSGAQVAIYIGDVLVDEVTSFSLAVTHNKTPLYGYASRLFDGVSEGNVIVQGQFSINFKEAGYLWLILNRYRSMLGLNAFDPVNNKGKKDNKGTGEHTVDKTIEQIVNGEADLRPELLKQINEIASKAAIASHTSLAGYSSTSRATAGGRDRQKGSLGQAESIFEAFENYVWGKRPSRNFEGFLTSELGLDLEDNRRADEPALNPFDIYIAFGDFVDDDRIHHTVQKIKEVHILGSSKQIVIDGQPVQEIYNFFAKDLI